MNKHSPFIRDVLHRYYDLPDHKRTVENCKAICSELWDSSWQGKKEVWEFIASRIEGSESKKVFKQINKEKFKAELEDLRRSLS